VDTLDLFILVTVLTAVLGGWRLGFLARATSWIGLAAGLVLAARLLASIVSRFDSTDPTTRLLVAAGVLVGGAFLGQALGLLVGAQFHRVIPIGPLRVVDRSLGAVAGGMGVLVAVWAMLPSMAEVTGWPARQARNSAIANAIDSFAPDPPDTLQALRRLVGEEQWPRVFASLEPAHPAGPPPVASGLHPDVEARVSASTVKVSGIACRRDQEGSGFVAATDTVVTNAHVVAGEGDTSVLLSDGRRLGATVVQFDSRRDLAVLRVPGLHRTPLPVSKAGRGDTAAVFGHPEGQDQLRVAPARIDEEIVAVGRDLYDQADTQRHVFVLAASLRPGDSGAALVSTTGSVVGVAFAIAPDNPTVAYALTYEELGPVLKAPIVGKVDTGPCLSRA
jgi:S1-C subfamily serine protease